MGAGGSGRGLGGQLDHAARRRSQAQRTRKTLNIDQERGDPQAAVRQNQTPGQVPASNGDKEQGTPQERMAAATERFFQKVKRPGATPVSQPAARVEGPQTQEGMVTERAQQLGMSGLSTQQQFYRLSGRTPTPRDIAVFRTVLLLERELGRKPTSIELRVALQRPTLLGISAPAAVEA